MRAYIRESSLPEAQGHIIEDAVLLLRAALADYKRTKEIGGELFMLEMVSKLTLALEVLEDESCSSTRGRNKAKRKAAHI